MMQGQPYPTVIDVFGLIAYFRPKWRSLGGIFRLKWRAVTSGSKRRLLVQIGSAVFAQLTRLSNPRNLTLCSG